MKSRLNRRSPARLLVTRGFLSTFLRAIAAESGAAQIRRECSARDAFVDGVTTGNMARSVTIKVTAGVTAQGSVCSIKAGQRAIARVRKDWSKGQLLQRLYRKAREEFGVGNRNFIRVELRQIRVATIQGSPVRSAPIDGYVACPAIHVDRLSTMCRSFARQTKKRIELGRLLNCRDFNNFQTSRFLESCTADSTQAEQRHQKPYSDFLSCLRPLEKLERLRPA